MATFNLNNVFDGVSGVAQSAQSFSDAYFSGSQADGLAAAANFMGLLGSTLQITDQGSLGEGLGGVAARLGASVGLFLEIGLYAQAVHDNNPEKQGEHAWGVAAAVGGVISQIPIPSWQTVGRAVQTAGIVGQGAWKQGWRPFDHPDHNPNIPAPVCDIPLPIGDRNRNGIPDIHETVDPRTARAWDDARNWKPRIDPLTLDLDGDGIETIGLNANNNVLFDHDGDGAKHGTGWVSADDAMLVLDRNNNGTIDNGRELFGDNTQLANGGFAADGFAALAEMDSNGDGKIDADDTQFANLRLWRDINQDGVSQSNELFTLGDYNIVSLNVAKVENTTTLANGNQIADLGTFTKIDGNLVETTGNMADVNLLNDRFNREFANTLDTSAVQTLPDMQACTGMFLSSGSGAVRDLREAANDATYSLAA